MPLDLSLHVLIVDDMPAMRSIVRTMLEEQGFQRISEAEDGELAWHLVQQSAARNAERLDLIIADWQMPGMSGVDLLRAVRSLAQTQSLPFFMITAKGDEAHIQEAVRAGVTDYLVKPFSHEQLIEKIELIGSP